MKKFELLTSNEKGFAPEFLNHHAFFEDLYYAKIEAKRIYRQYTHIVIINTKTKRQVK